MRIKTLNERMDEFRSEIFKAICELLKDYTLKTSSNDFYQFCNIQFGDKRIEFLVCAASESYTDEQEILIYYGPDEKRLRREFEVNGYKEVEPIIKEAVDFIKDYFAGKEEPESANETLSFIKEYFDDSESS